MQSGIAHAFFILEESNIHVLVLLVGSIVIEPKQISELPAGTTFVRVRIGLVFRTLVHLVHQLFPLNGFRQLLTQRPSNGHYVGEMPPARDVGHHLDQRRLQIDSVQGFDELQFRRRHQRRMKRTAHRQILDPTNAEHLVVVRDELQSLDEIVSIGLHSPNATHFLVTGKDFAFGVHMIRYLNAGNVDFHESMAPLACRFHGKSQFRFATDEDGHHAAVHFVRGRLHRFGTNLNQTKTVLVRHAAGEDQCRDLANAETSRNHTVLHCLNGENPVHEQSGQFSLTC